MTVREKARAKVNLGLAVTTRRGDGFHELDTIFALLDLHDTLDATPAEGFSLEVTGLSAGPDQDNLVLRAARAFSQAGGTGGAAFRLYKQIPVAAGLGGGSSDAAAALRIMARLYPDAAVDLPEIARNLGSDVPFFLSGQSAAWGRGRGERLEPMIIPRRHLVLANPGVMISSGDAYGWLQNYSRRLDRDGIVTALADGAPRWVNALQPGVVREVPPVREAMLLLRQAGLDSVLMSGSGATCFGLAESAAAAAEAAAGVAEQKPDGWVRAGAGGR